MHSGAAARQPSAGVALVAGSAGRASVALHPTTDAEELQVALHQVQPAGEASLEAALKLALVGWLHVLAMVGHGCCRMHLLFLGCCGPRQWSGCGPSAVEYASFHRRLLVPLSAHMQLVSRRFPASRTHVTAFVASSGAAASLAQHPAAAAELRQRFADSAVSLDVAVLCTSDELGAECAAALAALTGAQAAAASGSESGSEEGEGDLPAASRATRLLWLSPVDTAAESWQQLEPALEQLESGARQSSGIATGGGSSAGGGSISSGGSSGQSALPRRISRAPRQTPRTALLAARSGVQQPALCRGESLSRFGHLSSDGMARPWLPTYSSLGQAAKKTAAAAAAGAGSTAGALGCAHGLAGLAQGLRCVSRGHCTGWWLQLVIKEVIKLLALPPSICRNVLRGGAAAAPLAHAAQGGSRAHAARTCRRQPARQWQLCVGVIAAAALAGGPEHFG